LFDPPRMVWMISRVRGLLKNLSSRDFWRARASCRSSFSLTSFSRAFAHASAYAFSLSLII
jgi:hypothetical protein